MGHCIPSQQPSITKEGKYQIAPLHNASLVSLVIINGVAKRCFPAVWCSANKTTLSLSFHYFGNTPVPAFFLVFSLTKKRVCGPLTTSTACNSGSIMSRVSWGPVSALLAQSGTMLGLGFSYGFLRCWRHPAPPFQEVQTFN